jgi:hypothetical protein
VVQSQLLGHYYIGLPTPCRRSRWASAVHATPYKTIQNLSGGSPPVATTWCRLTVERGKGDYVMSVLLMRLPMMDRGQLG